MDIFDVFSIAGETCCNIKRIMEHNDDPIELLVCNFAKSKNKIDKMYDDEINKHNKTSEVIWEIID